MPYQPTGRPPGRPRKEAVDQPPVVEVQHDSGDEQPTKLLKRAREGFRRAFPNPAEGMYRPPRFGARKREVGAKPILHPNVIAKG